MLPGFSFVCCFCIRCLRSAQVQGGAVQIECVLALVLSTVCTLSHKLASCEIITIHYSGFFTSGICIECCFYETQQRKYNYQFAT